MIEALSDPDIEHIQLPFNLLASKFKSEEFVRAVTARPDVTIHVPTAYSTYTHARAHKRTRTQMAWIRADFTYSIAISYGAGAVDLPARGAGVRSHALAGVRCARSPRSALICPAFFADRI